MARSGAGVSVTRDEEFPSVSTASRLAAGSLLRNGIEVSRAHLANLLAAVEVLEAAPGCVGHPEGECG